MSVVRKFKKAVHAVDHAIGRIRPRRRVLVEMRTPVYKAVLGPVCDAVQALPDVTLEYTSEYPERIRPLIGAAPFISHADAEWSRFDLYLNADPWAAARLRRCAAPHQLLPRRRRQVRPRQARPGCRWDSSTTIDVAFINRDRMLRYLDAGVVTPAQAVLVGYPKLDRLAPAAYDGAGDRARRSGLAARAAAGALRADLLARPRRCTWPASRSSARSPTQGFNVIVKLHDRSLDPDPRYNAGIDWRARFAALAARTGRGSPSPKSPDASPLLAAADIMVTDHSSIGFEYLVLDRPLLVFDAPDLAEAARINPEKVALLRSAATVVAHPDGAGRGGGARAAPTPSTLSAARRRVAARVVPRSGRRNRRAPSR